MEDPASIAKARGLHRTSTRPDDVTQSQDATPSICRICRGEGTPEEPLFYPCKCSGSIKYVHQDCLMEWLSHSQKKYCELCKTSFRFTKLYAPDMPQSLPVHIFIGHMARYFLQNVLVWLRAAMAISVWLFWLPYFMRSVWSFMFWISDEGFGNSPMTSRANETAVSWEHQSSASAFGVDTCPASPLFMRTTTPASAASVLLESLSEQNISDFFMRMFMGPWGLSGKSDPTPETANATSSGSSSVPPTLLGDVAFLNNLTRNPTINRAIISVLEGQIITVLVIVCFILVILVRDYVVQQQPEMNMRAAFAAPENPLAQQEPMLVRPEDVDDLQGPDESDDETLDTGEPLASASDVDFATHVQGDTRRRTRTNSGLVIPPGLVEAGPSETGPAEPDLPTDINPAEERASVYDYLRIYRQADGDRERILEIIHEEGLERKLSYWVNFTRRALRDGDDTPGTGVHQGPSARQERAESPESTAASSSRKAYTPGSDGFPTPMDVPGESSSSKGKEREIVPPHPDTDFGAGSWRSGFSPSSSRPRAVSDGPQLHDSVNPLANNSWSFAGLPSDNQGPGPSNGPQIASRQSMFMSDDGEEFSQDATVDSRTFNRRDSLDFVEDDHELAPQVGRTGTFGTAPEPRALEQGSAAAELDNDRPAGLVDRVTDFMWGDLDDQQRNEQNANPPGDLGDLAAIPEDTDGWETELDEIHDDAPPQDAGVANDPEEAEDLGDAPGAGLDQEAMEDLEDFEGVMELIGMRGPVAGLFQNAIFCAVLVSVTIFACIFVPYNFGRVSVWVLANPMRLVRLIFELSKLLQDAAVMAAGFGLWVVINIIDMFTGLIGGVIAAHVLFARKASWSLWTSAGSRVLDYTFMDLPMSAAEMQNFSAISHGALLSVKNNIGAVFTIISKVFGFILSGSFLNSSVIAEAINFASAVAWPQIVAVSTALLKPGSWVINLGEPDGPLSVNPELAHWSGLDRFWAITAGYATLFFFGALYLKRGSPFSRGHILQAWEAGIIDTLHQASGIMKVIMIISIEMLVFPLYCGLLLDGALLPLFENTTFKSRLLFTYNYPLTSVFVHWKIMRQGVLYFIRDPDDPEFHPVRDVLERNLTTQLRKILFSAFVYGALVIVCLGGVVWGLSYAVPGVLPVHYSSNEPVLEFPVDLLFYNFLMPLAVNFFKPGDGLHAMYTWWFRTCARGLRLTYFLFGERKIDEEGSLQLGDARRYRQLPWYKTLFLELNARYHVVPKTWTDLFDGGDAKPRAPLNNSEIRSLTRHKNHLKDANQLVESGHFVRAPASDRVKIPKGRRVFLDVDEHGRRNDGQDDADLYASNQYQMVYIPPHFRARIFLFILFIWIFAAVTGVGFTIIPLVFGRRMFKMLIPQHIRTNDIYAFSIGVYLLGSAAYLIFHVRSVWSNIQDGFSAVRASLTAGDLERRTAAVVLRGLKLIYAYFFLLIVFPLLVSGLMELYLAIPLHTYMYPPTAASVQASREGGPEASRHTVRVIQAWTLGLLYLKLVARMITSMFPDTRLAIAIQTVLRGGWTQPDIGVLTRAFILPGLAFAGAAIFGPPAITGALIRHNIILGIESGENELVEAARLAIIYRHSYPAVALTALLIKNTIGLVKVFNGWSARIRDEAYLIGERLHNFGAVAAGAGRVRGAWRAGGARL
ncbi:SSM4-like protein [Fusarium heterosporum]|uniref:RING-type E3 ubiquitin transferase n=1 Tax=Fusarium heterosporum TaxID=42747 RepID=A0A8H5SRC9_FUSHE|nr:SSM4-like protein [Fusarium heterosporum]